MKVVSRTLIITRRYYMFVCGDAFVYSVSFDFFVVLVINSTLHYLLVHS